ncbi:hypothetical protein ACF2JD_13355 [Aeromonas sp. A-5]|uniref:hypothetical protein n=1 Tax=Aeromonas ichthyocola TaxID=3367746 RepID=UPI0038E5952F
MEGTDEHPLHRGTIRGAGWARSSHIRSLSGHYGHEKIVGHCDIAPGRKTDPGASFQWSAIRQLLNLKVNIKISLCF